MMGKLTDFELNKAIAEALGFIVISQPHEGPVISIHNGNPKMLRFVDYLNDWNDLMPLVVEYLPTLGIGRREFIDLLQSENPQRALAECLLKVLQEKQGDARH